ncbi:hypothetical protein NDU88_003115 [Pleurodeles waltl]|uniref:Uncharacterized protein n=1 Tax=Pleurodeles waltl TaxID=8319 RepID=A0AAV7UXK0_PLEWA|nr:hypothetical protein NDU88_003115 [Pleurodeles waltl]
MENSKVFLAESSRIRKHFCFYAIMCSSCALSHLVSSSHRIHIPCSMILKRLHAYSQCLGDAYSQRFGDAYSQCLGNALFLRTQYAQDCVRATLSSVSIHFLVALKSHHRLSWRREHADGRPRSFPLSWRHIYASRLVETCLCLALGARAQFQFLRSIKPKIVITIILADHSPAILEMRLSSSVPNVVPDRERPVSRNQGKRQHPVEASDT